ncbi:hypothetical protein L5515_005148 [Caenorhabditis briggsae]|uniref:F-box associated domain-containing protein n=1 Tax=Caenorhabditis briggsae TaxID=6238 RepID=A0AAE9ENE7_CAEBR|nr:hypothetical protein L5515_005148 [Caenorhabditis briggsae]
MSNQVQTRRSRLANDLSLNVLKTMDLFEIIAHSFVSKKALSMVQSLRLPIRSVQIKLDEDTEIALNFENRCIVFELTIRKQMASLNALPVKVKTWKDTTMDTLNDDDTRNQAVTMSNYGMTLGEWIQHLCSISENEIPLEVQFWTEDMQLDIQSLRNIFPKLRQVCVIFSLDGTNENEIIYAENLMRAFLSDAQNVHLYFVPLHFSLQHVGMANLKELKINSRSNLNYDFLFTLNVDNCEICSKSDQMPPLRDLNRFFKLWIKGSNPRLKELLIDCDTEIVPDWNVLLKGLRAEEVEAEGSKKYIIINCRGIRAQIEVKHTETSASVTFIVSK